MDECCPHRSDEHQLVSTCQVVIHYPSEDYPCLCHGLLGDGDICLECDHRRDMHVTARVCHPESGDYCGCRRAT